MSANDQYPPEERDQTPLDNEPEVDEPTQAGTDTDVFLEQEDTMAEAAEEIDIQVNQAQPDEVDEPTTEANISEAPESEGQQFPSGHLDEASKVRKPTKDEQLLGEILDDFEKIDVVAGDTGFKLESAIAKEEILQRDDSTVEEARPASAEGDKPIWKKQAEARYEAEQAKHQRMWEERRKLDEERRQQREAYEAKLKADREVYEKSYLSERAEREARLKAEREAADARLKAEREAKLKAREAYESQHLGEGDYVPEAKVMPSARDAEVSTPVEQPPQQTQEPVSEVPVPEPEKPKDTSTPSSREREAMNRLGKPPSDDDSESETE